MKTDDLIIASKSTPARIARQIVRQAEKDFVPEDLQNAVDRGIDRFVAQLRQAVKDEMHFT